MKITIVGGGNVGTQLAVHAAEKKHDVYMYSSKPEQFSNHICIINEDKEIIHEGNITCATNDEEKAFKDADIIFVTVPSFAMEKISDKILQFVHKGMKICIVPGTGGGECCFKKHIDMGAIVMGVQRVPSIARLVEYGKCVCATGYRDEMFVASIPKNKAKECSEIVGNLLDMKCSAIPNYLNLTLTPSNPILHTTRLKTIFRDYIDGVVYNQLPLFYEDWDDETSELLFKCDDEVQNICSKLKDFDLSYVKSLKVHYESDTPEALTQKIRSIKSFRGLETPSIKNENGRYIPDLDSRYFTADFYYGLFILIQIAQSINVNTPNMIETLNWYDKIAKNKERFYYSKYGINTYQDFVNFYNK